MREGTSAEKILIEKPDAQRKIIGKKWQIFVAIAVVLCAFVVGIGIYNAPVNRLTRQLELGNRYLEEQNYEQAIVEFDKAIDIDPMSVEAYLGKAKAYESMDNIDMALQTLQEGYDKTGDVKFLDAMQAINENIAPPVEQTKDEIIIENEDEDEAYPVLILEDDLKDLFDIIIQYCLNEDYLEAIDVLWENEFFELAERCASQKEFSWELHQGVQEYSGSTTLFIKTVYENYRIYIDYERMQTSEIGSITFVFLPESGSGGMVSSGRNQRDNSQFGTGEEVESLKQDGYMLCNTTNYNFNGDYSLYSISDQVGIDPEDVLWTFVLEQHENGKLKDNLYDGIITREYKYSSGTDLLSELIYDNGILQPQITEDGSYTRMTYSNRTGERYGEYIYNEEFYSQPQGIVQACNEYSVFIEQAPWE